MTAFLLASAAHAQDAPPADAPATDAQQADAQQAAPGGIVCGEPYVIRRGDTLQRLAVKVYGPEATYHALWAANRGRLGLRDPSLIEIGQTIVAPCPISVAEALQAQAGAAAQPMAEAGAPSNGAAPVADAGTTGAAPEADAPPVVAAPASDAARILVAPAADAARILVAPAADAATGAAAPIAPPSAPVSAASLAEPESRPALTVLRLPGAPLAQAVALRALGEMLGAGGFMVADAPDPAAHATGLRFPLERPDCGGAEKPDCAGLLWSAPLLEQALVWHARAGAETLTTRAALAGLRICRADSAPRAALAAPPGAQVRDGVTAQACLAAVAEGRADVAVSEAGAADAALRDAALAATVAEQPALTTLVTLAAAAPKDDPLARAALAALDLGLARMRASGAWFAQVDAALSLR